LPIACSRTSARRAPGAHRRTSGQRGAVRVSLQLRLQIGGRLRALQLQRRQEPNLRLSSSERMLLGTTMAVGLAFAREQGHER
jgi:hypothetical protein